MKLTKKENENPYFKARKAAALYNDRLSSRDAAADMIGVSVSSLADYELGNTKVVPVDKVVLMADLYNAPELCARYCKNDCPIGCHYPIATEVKNIEGVTLRLIREFDPERITEIQNKLIDITEDGQVTEEEQPELKKILTKLDRLSEVISELKLVSKKMLEAEHDC